VGYRYPHAYAEHWVAQQYLPSSLQGQLFWQPGGQGWEAQLRPRLQQRRAAQLAAAAETAAEQSDVLSFSPAEPELERWLARAAVAEGERLDQLRQRFWQHTPWQRHARVLILGARSLLWALDALEHTPEGQVVISAATPEDQQRLKAQLQVLDGLRQPEVVVGLEAVDGPFERLAGRQLRLNTAPDRQRAWLQRITSLAAPGAELRLLQSEPQLGPAGGLLELWAQGGATNPWNPGKGRRSSAVVERDELQRLAEAEASWLQQDASAVIGLLQDSAWQGERQSWDEPLQLTLERAMVERWFQSDQPYTALLCRELPNPKQRAWLQQQLGSLLGTQLPQRIRHQLLVARLAR